MSNLGAHPRWGGTFQGTKKGEVCELHILAPEMNTEQFQHIHQRATVFSWISEAGLLRVLHSMALLLGTY